MQHQWDVLIDDPSYHSFVVRLWRAPGRTEHLWHGELEDIQSGDIVEVSSLEEIISWIRQIVKRDVEKDV